MSQLQRIIVRMGNEADIPALIQAELGWDIDTRTLRVGNDSDNPYKVLTTGSTGVFDFRSATVIFGDITIGYLADLLEGPAGILIRTPTAGVFTSSKIVSSDGSVTVTNGDGQSGDIDISIDQDSIKKAIEPLIGDIQQLRDDLDTLTGEVGLMDDRIDALVALSGRPSGATHLATFTGNIIPDNVSIKTALQALETSIETFVPPPDALDIELNDIDNLRIKLVTGSILGIPLATPMGVAGIINGSDKKLIDDLRNLLDTGGFSTVTGFEVSATEGKIVKSDTSTVTVPLASATMAGLMAPAEKVKLSHIAVTAAVDLDQLKNSLNGVGDRLTTVENGLNSTNQTVSLLTTRVGNVENGVATANSNASAALNTANNAQNIALALNGRTSALENSQSQQDLLIGSIGNTLNNHEGRIVTLEDTLSGTLSTPSLGKLSTGNGVNIETFDITANGQLDKTFSAGNWKWPYVVKIQVSPLMTIAVPNDTTIQWGLSLLSASTGATGFRWAEKAGEIPYKEGNYAFHYATLALDKGTDKWQILSPYTTVNQYEKTTRDSNYMAMVPRQVSSNNVFPTSVFMRFSTSGIASGISFRVMISRFTVG